MLTVLYSKEVGSTTKQGAASTFLKDTLMRINDVSGRTKEQYLTALAGSFLISADNAQLNITRIKNIQPMEFQQQY